MGHVKETFLKLVRLGIGQQIDTFPKTVDWIEIKDLADQQGLIGVVLDGIEVLRLQGGDVSLPEKRFMVQWIGDALQQENNFMVQQKAAEEMALLFHTNFIRTYVLKGAIVAECYPKPEHRHSVDTDCYLTSEKKTFDAWSLGNDLIKNKGFEVKFDYYKNSTFLLPGLLVESHRYFTPFRGNRKLEKLEWKLQEMMREDKGEDRFEGSWLYRPPVMVSALFLIEHAYSHFLHEGLTWRHVLDWMMFSRKHKQEIDWNSLDMMIDEFGFRKFYDTYSRLGKYLLGEVSETELTMNERRMMEDIWTPLDLHETVKGLIGKLALVGNTLRARWKYHYFSEISMPQALWIQVKGFLFIKEPKLS